MNYVSVSGGFRVYGANICHYAGRGFVAEGLDSSDTSHMLRRAAAHTIQNMFPNMRDIFEYILPQQSIKPPPLIASAPLSYWTVSGLCPKNLMGAKKGPQFRHV